MKIWIQKTKSREEQASVVKATKVLRGPQIQGLSENDLLQRFQTFFLSY